MNPQIEYVSKHLLLTFKLEFFTETTLYELGCDSIS